MYVNKYVHMHACMSVYIHIHIMHVCINIFMYMCRYMYIITHNKSYLNYIIVINNNNNNI